MKAESDPQIDLTKQLTVSHLARPFAEWCDEVKATKCCPRLAFTSLGLFLGHVLAGVSEELGVWPDPTALAEMIAESFGREANPVDTPTDKSEGAKP
jgi:hypothetical protein